MPASRSNPTGVVAPVTGRREGRLHQERHRAARLSGEADGGVEGRVHHQQGMDM